MMCERRVSGRECVCVCVRSGRRSPLSIGRAVGIWEQSSPADETEYPVSPQGIYSLILIRL